jgi:hypothetical protein
MLYDDMICFSSCLTPRVLQPGTVQRGGVGTAGDGARHCSRCGTAQRGMGAPPRGGLGSADDAVSRDERSKELGISADYHSVDGVDRGESANGPVAVLERVRSRVSDFLRFRTYVL